MESAKNEQLEKLKDRIFYDELVFETMEIYEKTLNRLLEDSKAIALSLRFPYKQYENIELPERYKNWQLRCCEELYKNMGTQGIKSYSENGLSWTRDSAYITHELSSEIEPMAGYIVASESDSNV